MRFLGIDYGGKRVGIALSDEEGNMAFPKCVLSNYPSLLERVTDIAREEGVGAFVIGESKDLNGKENPIMEDIRTFAKLLEEQMGLPVHFEPEAFTSAHARREEADPKLRDASAAALILNGFLARRGDVAR